jgi:hypothetical protein
LVHGLAPSVLAPDNDFGTLRANFLCMILIRRDRKNLASAIGLSDVALRDRKCTRKDKAADRETMSMLSICWARWQRLCLDLRVPVVFETRLEFLPVHGAALALATGSP